VGSQAEVWLLTWNPFRTLYVYDPVTHIWTEKRPLPTSRMAAAGAAAQGKLYVVGGFTSTRYGTARVDAYTP